MRFEEGDIITFIGKNKYVRYVGWFNDGKLNATNYYTKVLAKIFAIITNH